MIEEKRPTLLLLETIEWVCPYNDLGKIHDVENLICRDQEQTDKWVDKSYQMHILTTMQSLPDWESFLSGIVKWPVRV